MLDLPPMNVSAEMKHLDLWWNRQHPIKLSNVQVIFGMVRAYDDLAT
jgi:hypothetical protein